MFPTSLARSTTALLTFLIALGLTFSIACQTSPEPEEDPAPTEPTEVDDEEPPADDPMAPAEEPEVDDETLDRFADAVIATAAIEEDAQARLQAAETPEEAQQVEAEIIAEMEQAVEDAGLTFEEYIQIAQQLQYDPELLQRLEERLEERGAGHLLQQPEM